MNPIYFENLTQFEQIKLLSSNVLSFMVLIADKNKPNNTELIFALNQVGKPFFGGIFPEIIFENQRKAEGMMIVPLPYAVNNHVVNLKNESELTIQIEEIASKIPNDFNMFWIYLDCFASNKTRFTETLYQNFGFNYTYIGGGSGSLSFQPMPCVFNNDGIFQNSAILAFAKTTIAIGVAHGWQPISEKMKVTETDGNNIISIDWKPAIEVYSSIVEQHSKSSFEKEGFFDLAKSYPLGMVKVDDEIIVRDPIMIKDNQLVIIDQVNQGEFIQVLNGNMHSLLEGAKTAKALAMESNNYQNVFCIDCISRVLYMNDDFQKEIDIIKGENTLNGILTIGEIANKGESFLDIYNKTTVVVSW